MEIFGIAITFFSLIIAYQTWQNGKWMKLTISKIDEHIKDMDERHTKLLAKMDEHLAKMDEHLAKMDEHLAKMDEHIKGLSNLIVEEARSTREILDRIDKRIPEKTAYLIKEK